MRANRRKTKSRRHTRAQRNVLEDSEPTIRVMVPPEQIKGLTQQQLDEEKTISLQAINPNLPEDLVMYHCNKGEYVKDERELSHLIIHFKLENQIAAEPKKAAEITQRVKVMNYNKSDIDFGSLRCDYNVQVSCEEKTDTEFDVTIIGEDTNTKKVVKYLEQECGEENITVCQIEEEKTKNEPETEIEEPQQKVKLRNQFKYSERACQTFNNPTRERGVTTVPPSLTDFEANVTRWQIYDAYVAELLSEIQTQEYKEKREETVPQDTSWKQETPSALRLLHSNELRKAAKQMEYVVHHNSDAEVYHDFKYWSGEPNKNDLLSLWSIKIKTQSRDQCVTSIEFNKEFPEMFAVGVGSYDFHKPTRGTVSLYTLKNPVQPEFTFETSSSVTTMDFSSKHSSLLCIGFYNGSVAVYDVRFPAKPLIYEVNNPEVQHNDPVWQVRWMPDDISFISVSTDAQICKWKLAKNELTKEVLMSLKRSDRFTDEDGILRTAQASACDLNPLDVNQCLIGTEFGEIYRYNLANENEPPKVYQGHTMQIYSIRWNKFESSTFISCSEDWTLKLWNAHQEQPIMVYDLISPVTDCVWAPYSSTVFSAVTQDNKINVFDISVNKNDASIRQSNLYKRNSLTKVAISADAPVLIAGNSSGMLTCFKIPEHLSKHTEDTQEESQKLESVLKITGTNVLDLNNIKITANLLEL